MIRRRALRRGAAGALLTLLASRPAAAHAFGARYDLPLPLGLYLTAAGAAVALSFVVMALFLRRATPAGGDAPGVPLPQPVQAVLLGAPFRAVLDVAAIAGLGIVLAGGYLGDQQHTLANILPMTVWVLWWVGLSFIAALLGNVWAAISPWDAVARRTASVANALGLKGVFPLFAYPDWLGAWPAVAGFFAFAWCEQVWPGRAVPANIGAAIILYSAVTWAGMLLFGRRAWLENADPFAMFFGLFGRFAPIAFRQNGGAQNDGRGVLVIRPYAVGLLEGAATGTTRAIFTVLVLATVTFDGISETAFWSTMTRWAYADSSSVAWLLTQADDHVIGAHGATLKTLGIAGSALAFLAVYAMTSIFMRWAAGLTGDTRSPQASTIARGFVLSLVPIAIAYQLAHFFSFLVTYGQTIIPISSDPLGLGWNLFGTVGYRPAIGVIAAEKMWYLAIAAIVTGHIAAVYIAHVTALRRLARPASALASQIPMLALMVGYTMTSLWILAQPIVG